MQTLTQRAAVYALSIQGLTRCFAAGARPAVMNVSLDVTRGEIVAILGASGSGKTTLLRMIAGFEPPQAGSITIGGVEVEGRVSVAPEKRKVGLVFQETTLFPHMTVLDNVMFGLQAGRHHRAEGAEGAAETRARELLALAGVAGLERRYPHEISGGQAQRVALARALAPAPEILLLDEPFNNLDAVLKSTLTEELWHLLRRTHTTTILVTHDLGEAFALADRVAVIRDGELQQIDEPGRLYACPVNAYVAAFLGRTNLVPARPSCEGCLTELGLVAGASPINHDGRLVVSVRPHDLLLHEGWGAGLCGVRGSVARVVFQGDRVEVLVTPAADAPEQPLVVSAPVGTCLAEGDQVTVCLRECPVANAPRPAPAGRRAARAASAPADASGR